MLPRRSSRDKKVEVCEGGAGSGISKWRSAHKQPCLFAFLTGVGGLRVQYGSRKGKSHQIYVIFFLDRVTRLLDEKAPLLRYAVDKNGGVAASPAASPLLYCPLTVLLSISV